MRWRPRLRRLRGPRPTSFSTRGFSLVMLATTPAGDAYTFRDLEAMYREAGFERMTEHALPPSFQSLVIGYAP
jgi:hypothetical protein